MQLKGPDVPTPPDDAPQTDWRPITRGDLPDLDALLRTIEESDLPGQRHSRDGLYETFDAGEADPMRDSLAGRDAQGTLIAYGWNHPFTHDVAPRRVHLAGGVHPQWRRRGVGHELLRWQLEQARQWYRRTQRPEFGPLRVLGYGDETILDQCALYQHFGLQPQRWYADMTRSFADPPPVLEPPTGVRIVPLSRKRFEAVREAHNEAFADRWGALPVGSVAWEEQLVRPESRLSWSWVALVAETSEVVGYATSSAYPDDWQERGFSEGWTDRLGVRKRWRGRGIARALLCASMRSFVEAGLDAAGLGVDSDDPCRAFELYESLGYRATHRVVLHARTEPIPPEG